jgi:hypothetical protein
MSDKLFAVKLKELDRDGVPTGREMKTVLSSSELLSVPLERLFELANGEGLKK